MQLLSLMNSIVSDIFSPQYKNTMVELPSSMFLILILLTYRIFFLENGNYLWYVFCVTFNLLLNYSNGVTDPRKNTGTNIHVWGT